MVADEVGMVGVVVMKMTPRPAVAGFDDVFQDDAGLLDAEGGVAHRG